MLNRIEEAVKAAFEKFEEDYGKGTGLKDGDEFVTVFNNAVLVVSLDGGTLRTKFLGGKPYYVDMTLAVYASDGGE